MDFWTLQNIKNKDGIQYFWSMMFVKNIDNKFIHIFNLLGKNCTKMIIPCHRTYPIFGDLTIVRSTSLPEYPLKITWKSLSMCIEKTFNGALYILTLWTSTWTPKWNFMTNGAFTWNFTKMGFWTLQIIENKRWHEIFLVHDIIGEHW